MYRATWGSLWNDLSVVISNSRTFTLRILLGNISIALSHCSPNVPVLRGLNINVKAGQYVALVGPSGCGKSTTVALIERFYDPIAGEVLVDGVPVSAYNLSEYRKHISIVGQEPTYFYNLYVLILDFIKEPSDLTFFLVQIRKSRKTKSMMLQKTQMYTSRYFVDSRFSTLFKVSRQDMRPSSG